MKLEKPLLCCARLMSAHALLCLLTLLVLLGLTLGLWNAAPRTTVVAADGTRSSGTAATLCQHAAVAFDPALSVHALSRLLRAEDAHILYGPDEFGDYHLRFGSATPPAMGLQSLQARAQVQSVRPNPQCP